jgi:holliday junction DNA helicase RuvB
MSDRIIGPAQRTEEKEAEKSLRPKAISDFIGQERLKDSLGITLQAARQRGEASDHLLFAGPPGLGKTTLAGIVAQEMDSKLHITSGPSLDKASDLAGILTSLGEGDVLFIDEIHRLPRIVEEFLYSAMEDFRLDIVLDSGPTSRSVNLPLKRFTLIGATTRAGMLTSPLRARFGIEFRLELYNKDEILAILNRSSKLLNLSIEPAAGNVLEPCCRGTPRIANRILRRCRDVAQVLEHEEINSVVVSRTLDMLGIDQDGLDEMDRNILTCIVQKFDGGPVGLQTLGAALGEESETIEEVYEPFLIQQGYIKRTSRGRVATRSSWVKLGFEAPISIEDTQTSLL